MMSSNKGQGALEFLVILSSTVFIFSLCFFVSLLGFTKVYLQHVGYQALICSNTDNTTMVNCKSQLKLFLKKIPFGELTDFDLNSKKVQIGWRFLVLKKSISINCSQSLNLKEWM